MVGEERAQRLALEAQQLAGLELVADQRRVLAPGPDAEAGAGAIRAVGLRPATGVGLGTAAEVEDRRLTALGVLRRLLAVGLGARQCVEHRAARCAGRVERPHLIRQLESHAR